MPKFKELTTEERAQMVGNRRRALEIELFQHQVNRIGAADVSDFDARIEEIEAALAELDRIDTVE